MKNIKQISNLDIPEIELYVGTRETHLLRYFEPEPGLFIAESKKVMELALRRGYEPYHVLCTKKVMDDPIFDQVGDAPIHVVDGEKIRKKLGYNLPGEMTCAMRRKNTSNYKDVIKEAKRIVVLEDVENPTNVGAIFRSAAALGVDAILLSPACSDPFYRRSIRVSMGNVLSVPWAYVCNTEAEWQETGIDLLKKEGFTTCAMALREDNITIDSPILKEKEKLAVIMGNEGNGLTPSTIDSCDYVAKIPMRNDVDSLNVAVAAGIAMWEMTHGI
ncbi:MAG: RNA methyltransferase [Eubacteriales bacterium]|nr:RNA methyltransferase [Eubacteriales bacterium]